MERERHQLEFGYFDDYNKKRIELFSGILQGALPVVGFDDCCFKCRQADCRCFAAFNPAPPAVEASSATAAAVVATVDDNSDVVNDVAAAAPAAVPAAAAPDVAPAPSKPSAGGGWANLFRDTATAQRAVVVSLPAASSASPPSASAAAPAPAWKLQQCVPPEQDRELASIGAYLRRIGAQRQQAGLAPPPPLQPRGLNNPGNYCYINAILQMLFLCPPFHAFFRTLGQQCYSFRNRGPSSTPALDCIVELLSYYTPSANPRKLTYGQPYTPHQAYHLVSAASAGASRGTELRAGREEDAEEFLSHLLNSLHDELARAASGGGGGSNGQAAANGKEKSQSDAAEPSATEAEETDADEWQCVGPKNRSAVTRAFDDDVSGGTVISDLFGGQLRHQLARSNRPLTANLQPFFVLPLDIINLPESAANLDEALEAVTRSELVETSHGRASKTQLLERLPRLLLLQLKRFHYADASGSVVKIDRRLELASVLKLRKAWLSQQARARPQQCLDYRLFAIVYHVGHATSGHYITAVLQPGLDRWLMLNDATVSLFPIDKTDLSAPELLSNNNPEQTRRLHPYLLMYRRADCPGFD